MSWFDDPLSAPPNRVNLSTSTATSSSALLSSVRAERQAREQRRLEDLAARQIQRVWRGGQVRDRTRDEVLGRLEGDYGHGDVERRGRMLVGLLVRNTTGGRGEGRVRAVVERWCEDAQRVDSHGLPAALAPLSHASADWPIVLAILAMHVLHLAAERPATAGSAKMLGFLEVLMSPTSWRSINDAHTKSALVESVGRRGWVETCVDGMEKLIASALPKKKHPHLTPFTRLLTAPLALVAPTPSSPLLPPMLTHLLCIPSLAAALSLPALTHLSASLPLFSLLLPLAASSPALLDSGRLATEHGKTLFLANLAVFGIQGGMLARNGAQGAGVWVKVVAKVLGGVGEGWGKWVEGVQEEEQDRDTSTTRLVHVADSDSDSDADEPMAATSSSFLTHNSNVPSPRKRPRTSLRPALPPNVASKLSLVASTPHLRTLTTLLVSPTAKAPTAMLVDFAEYVIGLLHAFRGTAKWEAVLDGVGSEKGLVRRVWREGVRGRWRSTADRASWDTFRDNPLTPCLLLLTYLYNHYLLLTPDDEFFAEGTANPLQLGEVLELAGIWRDLAFWGYMNGVAPSGSQVGKEGEPGVGGRCSGGEEERALFTRGVTRVAERNARRQFASEDFWVMSGQMDLKGFVEAAVFEDLALSLPDGADEEPPAGELPRWARARQRFTKRQMAFLSPRLGLLNNLPMAVPFQTRLEVFRQFVYEDYHRLGLERYSRRRGTLHQATIHRTSLAEDGFRQLNKLGAAMKGTIQITFIDKFGQEESGIDGGGLFKEFFTSLSKEAFDTNRGLWLATSENQLYPNPHSYATEGSQLEWYGFIGRVLGKALYEGILVDVSFAPFFLAKWLGRQSFLDDLQSLDKDLYKGLIILKNYANPEELALNFTVTEEEFGVAKSVDLVPNGSEIPVTADNRQEYIQLVCKYKLDKQISLQSRAFFDGLSDIIDPKWLRMFDQHELQQLIGGEETVIDMDDLRANSVVTGFPNDTTVRLFWKVVKGFSQDQRRALLRFVTSCSRPPLLGFAHLNPKFGIRFGGGDQTRLPSASSCANLLKLPGYMDEYSLRTKLLQAITSGAGFDLS